MNEEETGDIIRVPTMTVPHLAELNLPKKSNNESLGHDPYNKAPNMEENKSFSEN